MSSGSEPGQELEQLKARLAEAEAQARAAEERARRAEEAAARLSAEVTRNQRFEELIGYAPVVLWESWFQTDPDSQRIGFVSDYILTLSGYTKEEWLSSGNFWTDLIHPEDRERVVAESNANIAAGAGTLEYRWVRKDGKIIWGLTRMIAIRDDEGRPIGVRGVTVDINERKVAEAEREAVREQLLRAQTQAALSTPLIPITDRVMVMPLIGDIDAARAERALGVLLEGLGRAQASVVILDITGVPRVDASVAAALLRAARAAELLGAEVVLTGIRPEVAQTLVEIGADFGRVVTRGNLQGGVAYAMRRAPAEQRAAFDRGAAGRRG
ncbi:MAG: PAS domain-containing protein [Polyangiaceae bacterium]|nr:PAS domain-containing protein [Polyangiaceae bacterium]